MLNETVCSTESVSKCYKKCVSWSAIVVGALVAIGLGFLVYLLTAGLGLAAFTTDATGLTTLAIGGFIVLFLLSYITMFFAGWTSGILSKRHCCGKACFGGLHGFAAWCLALIIGIASHSLFLASGAATLPATTTAAVVQLANTPSVTPTTVTASKVTLGKNTVSKTTVNKTVPSDTTTVTAPTEKTANTLGIGILATFFLFFIGAIGSWMGGYFGVQSKCGGSTNSCEPYCDPHHRKVEEINTPKSI